MIRKPGSWSKSRPDSGLSGQVLACYRYMISKSFELFEPNPSSVRLGEEDNPKPLTPNPPLTSKNSTENAGPKEVRDSGPKESQWFPLP
jgi:hypothetical protein